MRRRGWLATALWAAALQRAGALPEDDDRIAADRTLRFPHDHGAHPGAHIEWWYATGALAARDAGASAPHCGFQVTFFRLRTGLAEDLPGRFAARQLLFAHAALTDLAAGQHLHAQRLARWDGRSAGGAAYARSGDADIALSRWMLRRESTPAAARYRTQIETSAAEGGFAFDLTLTPTQPLLLQGERGLSRKGPRPEQASLYYSEPQLAVTGLLRQDGGAARAVAGRAWLDREWSNTYLAPEAVGWDWIGINLDDGAALTAFRIRRADGTALWAGGSFRASSGTVRSFGAGELHWQPGRIWVSAETGARYPVVWTLDTPAGRFRVSALLDAQELDSRSGTGTVYWEGLAALHGDDGRPLGHGYLEMTGYAGRLRV